MFYIFYSAVLVNWVMITRILVRNSCKARNKLQLGRDEWSMQHHSITCRKTKPYLYSYNTCSNCFSWNVLRVN